MNAALLTLSAILRADPDPNPPLTDLLLFPHPDLVKESLAFAEGRRSWLLSRREWDRQAVRQIDAELAELEESILCWRVLRQAQEGQERSLWKWGALDDADRRQRLGYLRQLLGWRAYYRGVLPPPVPLYRFARAD